MVSEISSTAVNNLFNIILAVFNYDDVDEPDLNCFLI